MKMQSRGYSRVAGKVKEKQKGRGARSADDAAECNGKVEREGRDRCRGQRVSNVVPLLRIREERATADRVDGAIAKGIERIEREAPGPFEMPSLLVASFCRKNRMYTHRAVEQGSPGPRLVGPAIIHVMHATRSTFTRNTHPHTHEPYARNARLVTARANRLAAILRDAKGKMRKRRVLTDEKRGERDARDTRSLAIASRGRSRLRSVTNSGRPAPNAPFRLRRHSLVHLRAASFLPFSPSPSCSANIVKLFGSARRRSAKAARIQSTSQATCSI